MAQYKAEEPSHCTVNYPKDATHQAHDGGADGTDRFLVAILNSLGDMMSENSGNDPGHGSLYQNLPTWSAYWNPTKVGLDHAQDDREDAGHGPADKDTECDTEKEPEERSIGKEAAAIVVGLTRIEAAGATSDKRNDSSDSEKGCGDDGNGSVFIRDHREDKRIDALKSVHAKDAADNRVYSREKEVDNDIDHGERIEVE
jgi:hypothetical protein